MLKIFETVLHYNTRVPMKIMELIDTGGVLTLLSFHPFALIYILLLSTPTSQKYKKFRTSTQSKRWNFDHQFLKRYIYFLKN